ncbi:MAG: alpha/beta fold hydrolase [Planctomycetota bacterium]
MLAARWTGLVESLVFFAPSTAAFTTPDGIEDVEIPARGGGSLHGWWLPPEGDTRGTVLFLHGNAGNLPDHLAFVDRLPAAGFGVLMVDYRGFGRSSPRALVSRESLLADARASLQYMFEDRGVDPQRLGILGHSMGAVMAINLAAESPPTTPVAAVAPFTSFPGVASDHGSVLGLVLIRGGRSAASAVRSFGDRPLLLLHGVEDRIVRAVHSERIAKRAAAAGVRVETRIIERADHVSVFDPPADGQRVVIEFFRTHLAPGASAPGAAAVPGPPQ